uniref:Uncharacterized protein n=1 Tax=Kwoniella bestiolae CBS 10118 TaxID=1296100 RepID=A0A1B9GA15_9TREE|nr:hypothetical protein I302_02725 [Kwoniella bestiolae CBS 10118]OCF27875.1 hypothetical protein I302_02725 [Kwoniella bestiolae CBS 10118]
MSDQPSPSPSPPPQNTEPSTSSSSWRRLSHPPLPTFRPNIPNLRAALLGYLGEVEVALRSKLGDLPPAEEERLRASSSSLSISGSGEDDEYEYGEDDFGGEAVGYASSSKIGSASQQGLRNRFDPTAAPNGLNGRGVEVSHHLRLLNHLSTLREEALNYLPSLSVSVPSVAVPSIPSYPSKEWLRSLPSRLSSIDPGLVYNYNYASSSSGEGTTDHLGAIASARKRMVDVVHTLLPSEEWAGWERLGWEEQEDDLAFHHKLPRRLRAASLERYPVDQDEEEDEEPEYLFPNRTPASAQANRRRAIRSKSLGAAGFPTIGTIRIRGDALRTERGKLQRSKTDPYWKSPLVDDVETVSPKKLEGQGEEEEQGVDEEEDQDEEDEQYILKHPEITDTKLTALAAEHDESTMGPTVQESLKRSDDGRRLIKYEDLPAIWRNNEHIHTGYRFIPLHLKTGPVPLIKSAFTMHNETINIHSHFIPTILISLFIPYMILNPPLPNAHLLDTLILALYLIAAISCLFSSASWHVLSGCASKRWFEWGACVDCELYIGLIAASFGTVVYNGFYCQPKYVLLYCTTNALCGALGSYLPFQRWFNERRNKHLRISFFLVLCVAMFAPMLQLFFQHGFFKALSFVAPFGWSIATYLTGLWFYAMHFPECRWPGRFDRFGMSHQWWHAGIVLAIWLHYRAVFVAHGMKYDLSCAAPGAGRSVAQVVESWFVGR